MTTNNDPEAIILGWYGIEQLARNGELRFADSSVVLIAASDLFQNDVAGMRATVKNEETPELVPAPEGVEFAMRIFIHCDAANLSHVLNFPGNRFHPPVADSVDLRELVYSLTPKERDFLLAAGQWRVMTRDEITRYKRRMARLADLREAEEREQRGH